MSADQFRPYPDTHPDIYDRAAAKPDLERVLFREGQFSQGAELNEAFSRQDAKRQRVGNMVASDGDRIEGCDIEVADRDTGAYTLSAGRVYLRGDVRAVEGAALTGVNTDGEATIGVRIVATTINHEDDSDLLGLHEGTEAHLEAGAARERYTLQWGHDSDGGSGALYPVYTLQDGYVIDQTPPAELSGIQALVASYDYGAHENYIDVGFYVTALGKVGDDQVFSISEGIGNILGFKRQRQASTRFTEPEAPDLAQIDAEPHTLVDDGGSATIRTRSFPINGVVSVIIEKEFSETITRGGVAGTTDQLSKTSVTEIVSVQQGGTTYDETTDWLLDGDEIDWSPGGAEPATSSSYDVTYRYLEAVTPDSLTDRDVVVSGGVDGGQAFVTYTFKLPRIDRICMDRAGRFVYLKGVSERASPRAPQVPEQLLSLCEVRNNWMDVPVISNNGIRNYPFWKIHRMAQNIFALFDLASLNRLRQDISAREPTAKHTVFVDPFTSDRYRDAGEVQDAAVFDGRCEIAVDPDISLLTIPKPELLQYGEDRMITQDLVTGSMKINPYLVFHPLPIRLTISPSADFWEETSTTWLSEATRVFGGGTIGRGFDALGAAGSDDWRLVNVEVESTETTTAARFMRQIPINFTIRGLGDGELVPTLEFAGIDVNPGGLAGDSGGEASGQFTIPANVPAGIAEVYVRSGSGSAAAAWFEGRGTVTTITRQLVRTLERVPPAPPAAAPLPAEPPPESRQPPPPNPNADWTQRMFDERGGGEGGDGSDPLAQTFNFNRTRSITAIEVKFAAVGDRTKPCVVDIVETDNGFPTRRVIAQAEIDMQATAVGAWTRFTFPTPQVVKGGVEYAFVFRTDDPDHALHYAERGDFDEARQQWVGGQPYLIGVMFSSSNNWTWTPHQDRDLTMRVYGAVFAPAERTIEIGTVAVTDMTDLICATNVNLPTSDARFRWKITPDGEAAYYLENNQNWERTSAFTGDVKIEAVLAGSTLVSPLMGRETMVAAGTMRASGTYVSRAFTMGTSVTQHIRLKTRLPAGATLAVEIDAADDNWQAATLIESEALPDGSQDRLYQRPAWTADQGRVRLSLTGAPNARPSLGDLRSFAT